MLLAGSATLTSANSAIKKQIEQEGFEFIQQIPAPTGMTGWVGHNNQHPGTVFIAKFISQKFLSDPLACLEQI